MFLPMESLVCPKTALAKFIHIMEYLIDLYYILREKMIEEFEL